MFEFTGKIVYKPSGWVVVDAPNDIANYYRKAIEWMTWDKLQSPYHSCHVTVVNGLFDHAVDHPKWKEHHKKKIKLYYDGHIMDNGEGYFWLVIQDPSGLLTQIRQDLGFTPYCPFPWHLTVGHSYNIQEQHRKKLNERNI